MFAAPDGELREEWRQIVAEAKAYEQVLLGVFEHLELDAEATSPGRTLVNHQGESLRQVLEVGLNSATTVGAQSIARECIAIAHIQLLLSWYSIGNMATEVAGSTGKTLQLAFAEVEKMTTLLQIVTDSTPPRVESEHDHGMRFPEGTRPAIASD
jgi:hypothetical protein